MSIRCFIAIELDHPLKKKLEKFQQQLQQQHHLQDRTIRWVNTTQMHLTMKFMGDVEDRIVPDICRATSEAVEGLSTFSFEITGCGCFPPKGSARVIWAGVNDTSGYLQLLHQSLEDQLADHGFDREARKFSPHLTLARIKNARLGYQAGDVMQKLTVEDIGTQTVSNITVFQSDLTKSGPIYTPMHHAYLS